MNKSRMFIQNKSYCGLLELAQNLLSGERLCDLFRKTLLKSGDVSLNVAQTNVHAPSPHFYNR